jgi:hypothetical protein
MLTSRYIRWGLNLVSIHQSLPAYDLERYIEFSNNQESPSYSSSRILHVILWIYRKCELRGWTLALAKQKTIIHQRAMFDAYTVAHQGI